ncbi:hypothetical protein [Francisella frigiditurris]|uniref:DUF4124 domain-containing protein n=1 Tax=Francisella frigiditurris TaxID=1542390 RepID=A0A1J0KVW6_9GAMM|nr:hypothetical protein [Francisella frigiditurris]APC97764.1 hypothetical protein KX01_768 [Francisella frigiditurris]
MKKVFFLIMFIGFSTSFADTVYEWNDKGTPTFSNKQPDSKKTTNVTSVNVDDQPVTKIDTVNVNKQMLDDIKHSAEGYVSNGNPYTLQGEFPAGFTDNYFDFYGRNFGYNHLMSSNMQMGIMNYNARNNDKLMGTSY